MVTWQGVEYADWAAARAAMIEPAAVAVAVEDLRDTTEPDAAGPVAAGPGRAGRAQSLSDRWRPRVLADLAGQTDAVERLRGFLAAPYSAAFLFAGPTGTGKTTAALALAAELGCDVDAEPPEFGGLHSIASGEHTAAAVREMWGSLWSMPFQGSGWKVLVINEVERLKDSVEQLWLDRLEDMPPRTCIVFTTNDAVSLPARFVDRCECVEFPGDATALADAARQLAARIWLAETGRRADAATLGALVAGATTGGLLSFRRLLRGMVPALAAAGRKA